MPVAGAGRRICETVGAWEGVTIGPHRYGGKEFCLGKRELGHIHGDRLVDIPFPKSVRDEVVAAGDAEPHHILPESELDQPVPSNRKRCGSSNSTAAAFVLPCLVAPHQKRHAPCGRKRPLMY